MGGSKQIAGRWRGGMVVALAVSMLTGVAVGEQAVAAPPTSEPVGESTVRQLIADLAEAGVEVHPRGSQPPVVAPVSPLRLLRSQAVALAGELDAGGGVPVELLDAQLGPIGPGDGADATEATDVAASPSELVAAWAEHGGSAGATLAADAIATVNPAGADSGVVEAIPNLALVLFVAELATVGASLPPPAEPVADSLPVEHTEAVWTTEPAGWRAAPAAPAAPAIPAGPCSAGLDFINRTTAQLFEAIGRLRQPPEVNTGFGLFDDLVNGIASFVVSGVNLVIDGAHFVIEGVKRVAIGTVLSYVARVAAVAGTAAQIISAVRPWTLRLTPFIHRVIAPEGGAIEARVDLGGIDEWPDWAANCAAVAGVPLPPLRPEGNPITWTLSPPGQQLLAPGDPVDRQLRPGGTAQFTYLNIATPPEPGQATLTERVRVDAVVQRDDLSRLADEIQRMLFEQLAKLIPPIGQLVTPVVMPLVRPWLDSVIDVVSHLRDVPQWATVYITYADPNPPPTTQPPPPPPNQRVVVQGCPSEAEVAAATGEAVSDMFSGGAADFGFPPGYSACVYWSSGIPVALVAYGPAGLVPPPWSDGSCGVGTPAPTPVAGAALTCISRGGIPDVNLTVVVGDGLVSFGATTDAGALALAALVITTP